MELRNYQKKALEEIEGDIVFGSTEICLGAPTSFGKTITAGHFIKEQVEQGNSVVFMMNLTALVQQTIDMLKTLNIPFKVIAAEFDGQEFDHQAQVTVCMQQTMFSRIDKITVPKCDVLVIDEFHLSFRTDTMEKVKEKLDPTVILGLSATPYDERGYALPGVEVIETANIASLTKEKHLTPLKIMSVKFAEDIDLTEATGEYTENFLNQYVNTPEYINDVVASWEKVAVDRKTIVFSTGIDHSIALAAKWRAKGYKFEAYHSKLSKKDSKRIMDEFRNNNIQGLVSVNKILVGFDMPDITCGVACRPTKTRRVWAQASGRLIRTFKNKKNAILLDCAQWTKEHGFIDEPYYPPEFGNNIELVKVKEEQSAPIVSLLLNEKEPTLITRDIVVDKIEELKRNVKKIPQLTIKELLAIYNTSQSFKQIVEIAFEMNRRKGNGNYTDRNITFISQEWKKLENEFPQYSGRLVKMFRTMAKSKVASGKKLSALHYSPDWVRTLTPFSYKYQTDSTDVSKETQKLYDIHIDDAEIPF